MMAGDVEVRRVRRHFSLHAEEYDRYAVVQKRVVRHLLGLLPPIGAALGPVLDLGCGTGELAAAFARQYPQRPLLLADLAHGMARHAAASVPGAMAIDADASDLPLQDASCGMILSSSMYQWVNDLPAAFREVSRVLRPGGLFACALFGASTLCELRQAHEAALLESGQPHASHMQDFPNRAEVTAALVGAGLKAEFSCAEEMEYHPDVATLLHNLKRIGAQNASLRRPSGLAERRVTLRMMTIYAERYGCSVGIPASYEVISFTAQKV